MLADARVDVIGWSGTSSGWLGFDADRRLVERITERTGIPATTAVLALNELLALRGVTRLALVTPYTADVQQRIVDNYRSSASRSSPSVTWASASTTTSRWSSPITCWR